MTSPEAHPRYEFSPGHSLPIESCCWNGYWLLQPGAFLESTVSSLALALQVHSTAQHPPLAAHCWRFT